jgi:serine/threonine protein kinase
METETRAAPESLDKPVEEYVGRQFGPYKTLRLLGKGGMGAVYLAEQHEPFQRLVALKVIKPGMDTRQVIARFESERQALALMDHPNIARVFDAGSGNDGRPYFAMEYVLGIPITEYCDQNQSTIRKRLEIFVSVCQAVQHAHQKGIIHRDIKPSNVLVAVQDGVPTPKVIDFGVAKAINQNLIEQTIFTEHGVLIGTPEYMSPEQAEPNGLDVDTTTDVYSLGILLYELLVGVLPFDLKKLRNKGLAEILRIIREEDRRPLSTRLKTLATASDIAKLRGTNQRTLLRQLTGELDWITMRAIEMNRRRRYGSGAEFASDIQHYLNNEPVVAGPPSRLYRMRKFVSKHRFPVAAAVAVFAALCIGLAASTALYLRAERARQGEILERAEADRARDFAEKRRKEAERSRAETEQERDRADSAAADARMREQEAQWQSYVANIRAANQHILAGEFTAAQQVLLLCGPQLRGWEWRYLWARTDATLATLYAAGAVHSIGFSRDGSQILMASRNRVEVWNASTFKRIASYITLSDRMTSDGELTIFPPDSSPPGELQLTDPTSGKVVLKLQAPQSPTNPKTRFSSDGSLVAAGFHDGSVWIWNTKSGDRLSVLTDSVSPVLAIAFSKDNLHVAVGSEDGTMRVWDAISSRVLATIPGKATANMSATFSPDGGQLAWGTGDHLRNLDLSTKQLIFDLSVSRAPAGIMTITFACDNNRILVSRVNGLVELREAGTGNLLEVLAPPESQRGGHSIYSSEERVAVSPDGGLILITSQSGVVRVLDGDSFEVKRIPVPVPRYSGTSPLPAGDYSAIPLGAETSRGGAFARASGSWSFNASLSGTSFSPALAVSLDHIATVYQGRLQPWRTESASAPQGWHEQAASGLMRFSADGKLLAAATENRRIKVWNTVTWAAVAELSEQDFEIAFLAFSMDGRRLATVTKDGVVHVWDIRSGRKVRRLSASAKMASLDRDGSHVAVTRNSQRGSLQIFDVGSGRLQLSTDGADSPSLIDRMPFSEIQALPISPGELRAGSDLTFSPDGKQIAVAGTDSVLLRDANTGSIISKLEGAMRVMFTRDGSRLVTLDDLGNVSFWNPIRGDQVLTLHCGELGRAGLIVPSFDISMERLVCVANDGIVHTWNAQSRNYPGARDLATSLLRQHFLVSEAARYLEKDSGIAEPLRKAAIEALQARDDDLTGLADWVGGVVTAVAPSRGDYQLALRRLQTAASIPAPEAPLALRLGEVQYRMGRYEDALKSLREVTCTSCDDRLPFLAMTYQRLGKSAEAREQLSEFRVQLRLSFGKPIVQQPIPGSILARLLQEAEALIGGSR